MKDHRKNIIEKVGLPEEMAEALHNISNKYSLILAKMIKKEDNCKFPKSYELQQVIDWLKLYKEHPYLQESDLKELSSYSIREAISFANDFLKEFNYHQRITNEDRSNAIINYPNDWYWLDLKTNSSKFEGKHMESCGEDENADTLISLRDEKGLPHLTLSFIYQDKTLLQLKGKKNSKPKKEYYKKIYDIYEKLDISKHSKNVKTEFDFHVEDWKNAGMDKEYKFLVEKKPLLKYSYSRLQESGYYTVVEGGKTGYLNSSLEEIIPPTYSSTWSKQANGMRIVEKNGKKGILNEKYQEILKPIYAWIESFNINGIAIILDEKYGLINEDLEVVLAPIYDRILKIGGGRFSISLADKWGILNKHLKEIVAPKYDFINDFSSKKVARIRLNNKYGYINHIGLEILPPIYDYVYSFTSDNKAEIRLNNKIGYVDLVGNITWD